jgi:hypothetical protein
MAKELFITENKKAIEQSFLFFPRDVISRKQISKINPEEITDVILDGEDTETLDVFTQAKKWYLPNGLDFNENIDILNTSFTKGRRAYETPAPKPHTVNDDYLSGDTFPSVNNLSPDPNLDEYIETEIPLDDQISILQPLLDGKKIGAGSIAELTSQLVGLCRQNTLFVRDTVTGLYKSVFARKPLIPEEQAQTIFETHFWDKLAIRTSSYDTDKATGETVRKYKYHDIKPQELKLLWRNVGLYSTFNSRKEFYDAIPQWDGEERIRTFMKKYFNCDTNPNFFLLLMTSLVAKFSPRNDYCPYFFDIVAEQKGIGKSFLCKRLVDKKYVGFLKMSRNRGMSDFFVDAYDGNNAIVVDDECTWCGSGSDKISYDELKNLVTVSDDKFSRKGKQPEQHERSFIIIRTSNFVQQVFSTNERRQIIFECHLKEKECRIKDLPDEFFQQMLAEAKQYYIEHNGIYQLTDDDQIEIKETNLNNYNWETKENYAILDYISAVREDPDKYGTKLAAQKFANDKWGSHKKYNDWCEEHRKPSLPARSFWRAVSALAELPEHHIAVLSNGKYDTADGGHARVFRVDPVGLTPEEKEMDELVDLPL